jgi:cardiolipin synthase
MISFLLLIQLSFFFVLAWQLWQQGIYVYFAFWILSVILSFAILNRSFNPAYKMSWLFLVLVVPFAGAIFYLMFGRLRLSRKRAQRIRKLYIDTSRELEKNLHAVTIDDEDALKTARYITHVTGMQPWDNTITKYLSPGEDFFSCLIEELKKAEKFIFMEYFIVRNGYMFDTILEILEEKVNQGVDVRIIYDDLGCMRKVRYNFKSELIHKGIKVINFNPFRPRLSMIINYRDHRKMTVIDGNVGFTGGINLSDEYINKVEYYGYWKDSSIMLKGDAVWNLTFMFLQIWQFSSGSSFEYDRYRPTLSHSTTGVVQPFGDGPMDDQQSIETVYINIISQAKKYVYISTPYLILDNEIATALKTAALSRIDVRICMPHIPDKKMVFYISQSYYPELIAAGVKIYEYIPGFLHAKSIVADDRVAMIGTANLDYRSLYLHFEVSCFLYNTSSIADIVSDIQECVKASKQVTIDDCKKRSFFKKIIVGILRVFAPMI